ncbi:DNA-binding transcriptional regulator, AcrR family [Propionibacterium cyclohexanicum]|uniref:DNA-binding transcriptional regulator, AcrR family n=1 Tax=Propionibacterium cyclohexanicum TaxID=64702 RepID=A0A1H9TL13_9ACTN|nr:TetR/AcrR family transcriptional regulator [Propionibacterium cyclohexanicum]SER97727.1 DNA-binding transcriptional regulator, AcrR family [Propionibacterium cyclohexanicum]
MTMPARVPRRAAPRRAAILETARRLFTEQGIGPVTTNLIAQQAGISPGNLYYWFGSKAEIVRALFDDWTARMSIPEELPSDPVDQLRWLWRRLVELPQPDPDYAFFLRDLFPLLHADPLLATTYRSNHAVRRDRLAATMDGLVAAGLVQAPTPPTTTRELVDLVWLVTETAQPFAAALGEDRAQANHYARTVAEALLTDEGRDALELAARRTGSEQ